MKVYTAAEMRAREQMAVDAGTSFEQLMENAGSAAAADLLQRQPDARHILMVCGKGNNGGDALVMARILQQHGWSADIVFLLGSELSELAEHNRRRLLALPRIRFIAPADLADALAQGYDVVVDGIFGTGFNGRLPENLCRCCRLLNQAKGFKVALDLPTGLNGDTAAYDPDTFRADLTYAFAAHKPAHLNPQAAPYCGETVCLDIGID